MLNGDYYSKGKFLLTGEYLVLQGATALAVPLKFGQRMKVGFSPDQGFIKWDTYVKNEPWFSGLFDQGNFEPVESSDRQTSLFISKLIKAGNELQPGFLNQGQGVWIRNEIDFDISWGLGSSSSLVSNFASWLGTSPWALYRKLFRGSGYDLFCARAERPIIYQLNKDIPAFMEINFKPEYAGSLYFVYLGKKQDSQKSVSNFLSNHNREKETIAKISELTRRMINAADLDEFKQVIAEHENIISRILGVKRIKEDRFPDFPGEVKSLGAWGGDFVLAASNADHVQVMNYFSKKKLDVIFKWTDIVY